MSNDGDTYIDCDDFDCGGTLACGGTGISEDTEEKCSDEISNDGDAYVDCDDFDGDDTLVCGGNG